MADSSYQSVCEHGVANDGSKPCGAILNALFAQGGGKWYFPSGNYLVEEPLRVGSDTELRLEADSVLRLADGAAVTEDDYLLTNANPARGDRKIAIHGGIFDGNQIGNPRPDGLMDFGYTGAMLHFENVTGLALTHATLRDAEAYYARFTRLSDFHIEDITFDSQMIRHNNDGIHLGGNCSKGVIRKLRAATPGVTGDDFVALNADDALLRNEVRGMTNGDIEDILIEDLEAYSCHTFVRLLCVTSTIRNVTVHKARGGCKFAAINADGARGCRVPVFDEANPPYPGEGVGMLENIDISDFRVHKVADGGMALIDIQERAKDFRIRDFERVLDEDLNPRAPTVRFKHMHITGGVLNDEPLEARSTLAPEEAFESSPSHVDLSLNPSS